MQTYRDLFNELNINLDDNIEALYMVVKNGDNVMHIGKGDGKTLLALLSSPKFQENLKANQIELVLSLLGIDTKVKTKEEIKC